MRGTACTACLRASVVLVPAAAAQTPEEQAFLPSGVAEIGCEIGTGLITAIFGRGAANTVRRVAGSVGLCPDGEPRIPTGWGATSTASNGQPAQALAPGLQVRLVAVRPVAGGEPRIEAASPATSYRLNDGFAALVSNNAPGYLEVWSVDGTGATFIEGHVLDEASTVVLPGQVSGYYRLTTQGGRDSLRLRFHPCRPGENQAFAPQPNAHVAAQLSEQQRVAGQLAQRLPVCPFNQNISLTHSNDALFANAATLRAPFSSASGAYTITSPASAPFVTDIELRRN